MPSSKLKRNVTATANFKRYDVENRYDKNRLLALTRHAKKHPNDSVCMIALRLGEKGKLVYRRNNRSKGRAKPKQKKFKLFQQDTRNIISIAEQLSELFDTVARISGTTRKRSRI